MEDPATVVRVKVKKYSGGGAEPETKSFSMDPNITNYEMLRSILAKAFQLHSQGFVISYVVRGRRRGEEDKFLPMLSEWDLRTAVYGASQPQLLLKLDLKPFEEGLEEWDIIETDQVPPTAPKAAPVSRLAWLPNLSAHAAKLIAGAPAAAKASSRGLSDQDFRALLDSSGALSAQAQEKLRLSVFQSGVEGSLRPVVWRHLLNLYPVGMEGAERIAYTKALARKYVALKECWQRQLRSGRSSENLRLVANAVRKDVVRTDRTHPFFAGPEEENRNLLALFNLLTTYALAHPDIAYCQGMSDLASPILVVMGDEAEAYVCFAALMRRLRHNFSCDGRVMTEKFRDLAQLLQYYDPVFWEYLLENHAEDLLFCYRWLLLELKREFAFEDALLVLEVMWASLPPDPPGPDGISLCQLDLTRQSAPLDIVSPASGHRRRSPVASSPGDASTIGDGSPRQLTSPDPSSSSFMDEEVSRSLLVEQSSGLAEGEEEEDADPFASSASVPRGMHGAHGSCPGGMANACDHLHRFLLQKNAAHQGCRMRTASYRPHPKPSSSVQPGLHAEREVGLVSWDMSSQISKPLKRSTSWPQLNSTTLGSDVCLGSKCRRVTGESKAAKPAVAKAKRFSSGGNGPRGQEEACRGEPCQRDLAGVPISDFGIMDSLSRPRLIRGGVETAAVDGAVQCSHTPDASPLRPTSRPSRSTLPAPSHTSPIPVATEASDVGSQSQAPGGELTLNDIFDICVTQATVHEPADLAQRTDSGLLRSRQTSGEDGGDPPTSSSNSAGSSKAPAARPTSLAPGPAPPQRPSDSGYSGTTGSRTAGPSAKAFAQFAELALTTTASGAELTPSQSSLAELPSPALASHSHHPPSSTNSEELFLNLERDRNCLLPPPDRFGDGNPFMMFICLTLLLEHRDRLIKRQADFNDIAIYFDKLARQHSAPKILRRARLLYADYLSDQQDQQ